MKLEFNVKETKAALAAIEAMGKGLPNTIAAGDAPIAILRRENGFSLVAVDDYYTVEIPLPSLTVLGNEDDLVTAWDESEALTDKSTLGLKEPIRFGALLGKLGKIKTVTLNINKDRRRGKIKTGDGNEYTIELAVPRKVVSSFEGIKTADKVMSLDAEQFEWFCQTVATLGKLVSPSMSKPGFGCVILSSFPSKEEKLQISGNSDSDGYSVIYGTNFTTERDFTALFPKKLSEAFGVFISKIGMPSGDVELSSNMDEDGKANNMVFSSESFSLSIICMQDDFPFSSLGNIVKLAHKPYCIYDTTRDEIKSSVGRIGIFGVGSESVTDVSVLDGGTVELVQKKNIASAEKPARELCSEGTLSHFPDKVPSLGTTVKSDVLKKIVNVMPAKTPLSFVICEARPGAVRRLAMFATEGYADVTAVLLGLRGGIS